MSSASSNSEPLEPLTDGAWSRCEALIRAFEVAWRKSPAPEIDDYLQVAGPERQALLVELVHADLEFRLKSGEPIRVETYLDRYPELVGDRQAAVELVATEYELRRRRHSQTGVDEYRARFPAYDEELRGRLLKLH